MGPLPLGSTLLQKYRIVRLLAESGGVILYEATDTARAQRVWVKILQPEALTNADALAQFQLEASGAKVLDVGKSPEGLPYMVATDFDPPTKSSAPPRAPSFAPVQPLPRAPPPRPVAQSKKTLMGVAPPSRLRREEPVEDTIVEDPTEIPTLTANVPMPAAWNARATAPSANAWSDAPTPARSAPPPIAPGPIASIAPAPIAWPPMPMVETVSEELGPIPKRSSLWLWVVALPLVAGLTGFGGWFLGHRQAPPVATPTTVATQTAVAQTTVPPPPPIELPKPEPIKPIAELQTEPKAPESRPDPKPELRPELRTAAANANPTPHPVKKPAPHATSSDPLTL